MDAQNNMLWQDTSGTSCVYKWAWSTTYLNKATTKSCFHNPDIPFTPENFSNFHNLKEKQDERRLMLDGKWPKGCDYCRKTEAAGGKSDRMTANEIPGIVPIEVIKNPTTLIATPKIVEIFISNVCNFKCIYCGPKSSSKIQAEIIKFGEFKHNSIDIKPLVTDRDRHSEMMFQFWAWLETSYSDLHRLNILGGEPLIMPETLEIFEFFNTHPNPNLELNVVSNINVDGKVVDNLIAVSKQLVKDKKIKRVDFIASIDSWDPSETYIRNGLDLKLWESNFSKLLATGDEIYLGINLALTNLSLRGLPKLIRKWNEWSRHREIGLYSSRVFMPPYLGVEVLPYELNREYLAEALLLMPENTWLQRWCKERLNGATQVMANSPDGDPALMADLKTYLTELDRRRGTNWREVFPWAVETLDANQIDTVNS